MRDGLRRKRVLVAAQHDRGEQQGIGPLADLGHRGERHARVGGEQVAEARERFGAIGSGGVEDRVVDAGKPISSVHYSDLSISLDSLRFFAGRARVSRGAAAEMPEVPGIQQFVVNWQSLSPRHRKRVALSIAPWARYVIVLARGGATFYIKPLYMLLSDCPDMETLHDQRINYDSRLWDDVRGAGGYHTVTGIEDVERTIFDRYDTVLHELSHQVHGVLVADDSREIQEHYRRAKARDDSTKTAPRSAPSHSRSAPRAVSRR